jgi:ABC-type multidrug transport system ATPase subunit
VIVDEPTAGLDPAERSRLLDLLADVAERAVVILSTHIVEDVQDLCSMVAIMHRGEVVRVGAPDELTAELRGSVWEGVVDLDEVEGFRGALRVLGSRRQRARVLLRVTGGGPPDARFVTASPNLEDVYMQAVGTA